MSGSSSEHPVRAWARQGGVSMKDVARRVGVSTQSIWYWGSGRSCPSPDVMKKIESVTGGDVKPDDCINYYMENRNV